MIKIGIRAHDLGRNSAEALVQVARDYGFEGFQLVFQKALKEEVSLLDASTVPMIFSTFPIFMIGSYFNMIHPDESIRLQGKQTFLQSLKLASLIQVPYVGTETGSFLGSPWNFHPYNHSDEALEQVIAMTSELVDYATSCGSIVAMEGAYAHVAYSPLRVQTIVNRIQSRSLKVIVDLYNFLHIGNHESRMQILEECFQRFQEHIVIFHLKDYIVENSTLKQVGLGQGLMDYKEIMSQIKQKTPNAICIFEGVIGEDIASSIQFIKSLM